MKIVVVVVEVMMVVVAMVIKCLASQRASQALEVYSVFSTPRPQVLGNWLENDRFHIVRNKQRCQF